MSDKDEIFPHDAGQDAVLKASEPTSEKAAQGESTSKSTKAEKEAPTKKKGSSFIKTFILFLLIIIGAAWAFWQFNNAALQSLFENNMLSSSFKSNPAPSLTPEEDAAQPTDENSDVATDVATLEQTMDTLFTDGAANAQDDTAAGQYDINTDEANANTETPDVTEQNSNALDANTLTELQNKLDAVETLIQSMEQRQLFQMRYEVRSAVFALLNRASSPSTSLLESANAWKSMTFLANLNPEKRAMAEQAFQDLRSAQQNVQAISDEIKGSIYALAQMLKPADAAIVKAEIGANDVEALVDLNWLEWLKSQFHFSKVSQDAIVLADRYQAIKNLIGDLQLLQTNLQDNAWAHVGDMEAMVHQLEQRGIDTTLSNELLSSIQQTQQHWQQEAAAWMEQL